MLDRTQLSGGGRIRGSVVTHGTIVPAGNLTIEGDLTQLGDSRIELDIGGTIPTLQHDVLTVTGRAQLSGSIKLTRVNDYVPSDGESVRPFIFASRTGVDPEFLGLDFGGNAVLLPRFAATNLTFSFGFSSGPRVISIVPSNSSVASNYQEIPFFDVTFNEAIDPSSFDIRDIQVLATGDVPLGLFHPAVLDDSSTRFRVRLDRATFRPGPLSVTVGPGISDFVGNLMNQDGDQINGETNDEFRTSLTVSIPDLEMQSVVATPSTVDIGAIVEVRYTVRNSSQAAAGVWSDQIYLSRDSVIGPDDYLLSTLNSSAISPVAAGGSYTRTVNVSLPLRSDLLAGSYRILVMANADSALADVNVANNLGETSLNLKVPVAPDLQVESVSGPTSATAGQEVEIAWTVKNVGPVGAKDGWRDAIFLTTDGTIDGRTPLAFVSHTANVESNQSYSERVQLTVPSIQQGTFRWVVVSDYDDSIYEGPNSANNLKAAANSVSILAIDVKPTITSARRR